MDTQGYAYWTDDIIDETVMHYIMLIYVKDGLKDGAYNILLIRH